MEKTKTSATNSKDAIEQLRRQAEELIAPLGYEVVALERTSAGGNRVILYIDFAGEQTEPKRISLDDCVAVNRAVDELFENTTLISGHFALEVSSPGVERPLRKAEDYVRFSGKKARVNLFRPLEKEESENPQYWEKNRKQKNFLGKLQGLTQEGKLKLDVEGQAVTIPLALVSKAHLEYEPQESSEKRSK